MPPEASPPNFSEHSALSRAVDRLAGQLARVSERLTEVSSRQTEQLERIADEQRRTASILERVETRLSEHDTAIAVIRATAVEPAKVVSLSRRDAKIAGALTLLAFLASGLLFPVLIDWLMGGAR